MGYGSLGASPHTSHRRALLCVLALPSIANPHLICMATLRVPAQLLLLYPSLSPSARPHHVVLSSTQRKSGPPSRRSARTTLDKAPRCAWHCRVRESNSVPPHPPLSHIAPCDVGLYRVPPPLCVWARPCVRPPLLIAVCVVQGVITSLCGPALACGRGHRLYTGSAELQRF